MRKQYHILNGDSLKMQFPENIQGDLIIARECLVDGNVKGNNLDELFKTRAKFIRHNYGGTEQDYYNKAATEFLKIPAISEHAELNLWFEDDLFCQVNFWFVIHLIYTNYKNQSVFLIRPKINCEYNFGAMSQEELYSEFQHKIEITLPELKDLSKLWELYQDDDCAEMIRIAGKLTTKFPFLSPAIKAHQDRIPQNGNPGRPTQTLINLMDELNTTEFDPIFKAFCKQESIYGFGDLQVKGLLNDLKNKHK